MRWGPVGPFNFTIPTVDPLAVPVGDKAVAAALGGTNTELATANLTLAAIQQAVVALGAGAMDVSGHRQRRAIGSDTVYHAAGQGFVNGHLDASDAYSSANMIFALPIIVARDTRITTAGIRVRTPDAAGLARVGFYDSTSEDDNTPSALLMDVGLINITQAGLVVLPAMLDVTAPKVIWEVFFTNSAVVRIAAPDPLNFYGLLGRKSPVNGPLLVGWAGAQAFGALPDPFPSSPTPIPGDAPLPTLVYAEIAQP